MLTQAQVVFLFDVDNTLFDNDCFAADLSARLRREFGGAGHDRYWALYAKLRDELGYADYLAALQEFRAELDDDPRLLQMSAFLLEYPFAQRLYPRALEAIAHLGTLGLTAVLSDGDVVFQPRKIQLSGIWDAFAGRVLITLHKERRLELVKRRFPASHYVMIEDKPQLLAAMKQVLGAGLTTVFVRQGHYAAESGRIAINPMPDMTIGHIGDLCDLAMPDFHAVTASHLVDAERQSPPETTSQEHP
ncbi:MAG TPA: HAD family hydrolase [Burkholderiales bacterium]|nr:HAD family hydrolase [Burkholderiales bacterium]